ncbi:MAG: hypothetical protein GY849_21915 [Deltaproteobacteria bacterium]|nr:hypothetical protein [Deltaproteobacteria bacterium]
MNYLWVDVDDDTNGSGLEANPINYTQFGAYLSGDVVVGLSAEDGDIYYIRGNRFLNVYFNYFSLAENSFSATSWNDDGNPWGINRYHVDASEGNDIGYPELSTLTGNCSKVYKDSIFYRTNIINNTSAATTTIELKNCVFGNSTLNPLLNRNGYIRVGTNGTTIFNGCSFVDTYANINIPDPS